MRLIALVLPNRSAQELRRLASILQNEPHVVALLATYDGSKFTLVVACAADSGVDANALIRLQLAEIGGRGGGDSNLAQGGGSAEEAYAAACFAHTRDYVHKLLAEHKWKNVWNTKHAKEYRRSRRDENRERLRGPAELRSSKRIEKLEDTQ